MRPGHGSSYSTSISLASSSGRERCLRFIVVLLDVVQQPRFCLYDAWVTGLPAHQCEMLGADADAGPQWQTPAAPHAHPQRAAAAAHDDTGSGGGQHVVCPAPAAPPPPPVGFDVLLEGMQRVRASLDHHALTSSCC